MTAPADSSGAGAGVLMASFATRRLLIARPSGLEVWTAEQSSRDGRSIHYVVATSPRELACKLATIEARDGAA